MPIAALLDQVASYGQNKALIEPAKKNNARLRIATGNLLRVLKNQFSQSSDQAYLTTISAALQGDVFPLDVSFTPPAITTESRSIKGFGNTTVNYGGWTTFGNMACTFNNFLYIDTYKFFYFWATLAGGLNFNYDTEGITPLRPNGNLPVPDLSGDSTSYRVNATISQYYTNNTKAGDETEYSRWVVQNIWPTNVSTDGFNLEDMGTMIKTTVEFAADICLPISVAATSSAGLHG